MLTHHLVGNANKKATIYSNLASSLENIKDSIDFWLDETSPFAGNALLITGAMEPELKLKHTNKFVSPSPQITDEDSFVPRILLAAAGCIGAGLGSSKAHRAIRIGFSSSVNNLAQEMGRCGCGRGNDPNNSTDKSSPADAFELSLCLNNFVHMMERICAKDDKEETNKASIQKRGRIITMENVLKLQKDNLLKLLCLLFTDVSTCIHCKIESQLSSPMEPTNSALPSKCGNACPNYVGTTSTCVLPIRCKGMVTFLISAFILSPEPDIASKILLKKLKKFPNIGQTIYGRKRFSKPPQTKFLESTMLQLIATNLISIQISTDKPTITFRMGLTSATPPQRCCLLDCAWDLIPVIP